MATSKLPKMDARLAELPGPAKIDALMCGLRILRKDVAAEANTYAMDVTRELAGVGSADPKVRAAFSKLLKVPRREIDAALDEAA